MSLSCWLYNAGYAGCDAPRALFVSLVLRPMMLGVMAGIDQMDSCSVMCKAGLLVQLWSFRSCSSSQVEQDISPSWRSCRSMVQTVFLHRCSTRWPMSLLCRSSCFPGFVAKETVEISQLLRGGVGLMGGFFRALYTGTGPGVVSTGTRPP